MQSDAGPVDRRHVPVALCLAESLIRCGGKHDDADQLDTFVLWYSLGAPLRKQGS